MAKILSNDDLLEEMAYKYVTKNARYHGDAPPDSRYSVRYPMYSSIGLFSDDTRDLVEQVKKLMAQEMKSERASNQ